MKNNFFLFDMRNPNIINGEKNQEIIFPILSPDPEKDKNKWRLLRECNLTIKEYGKHS